MHLSFASILDNWYPRLPDATTATSSGLEALPIELLEVIFQFACTDGGCTGCNLALVCKFIRTASRASRFHSVSILAGLSVQLKRFLHALNREQAEARAEGAPVPRVRHLCILLTPTLTTAMGIEPTDLDDAIRGHWLTLSDHLSPEDRAAYDARRFKEYHAAFVPLFAAVYTDLETLCLLQYAARHFPAIPPIPCPGGFPRLRELTINENVPPFTPPSDGTPLYPALTRLHMSLHCNDWGKVNLPWLAANAPHLAWLRIDALLLFPDNNVHIASDLARVLGMSLPASGLRARSGSHYMFLSGPDAHGRSYGRPGARAPTFSSLNTLMLMIRPVLRNSPSAAAAYAAFVSALDAELRPLGVPQTVLHPHYHGQEMPKPPGSDLHGQLEEGMRSDWLLRVGGGQGIFTPEFWTRPRADPEVRVPGTLESLRYLWKAVWAE